MDGGDKPDQCGRIGHRGNEERQDGPEGCEAQGNAKQAGIYKPGSDVKAQMLATELFNFGEREHGAILIQHLIFFRFFLKGCCVRFPLDNFLN